MVSPVWGAVLADVACPIARALQQQEGTAVEQTVQRIVQVFHEEINSPAAE